jgi:Fe-S oxidoreductase
MAAAEVLERAGFSVRLPRRRVCCGRPLYEFGYLDEARAYLRRTLATLEAELRAGTPIVVLEPACLSVFKEELPMMLPRDEQARRLRAQSFLFSDFLRQRAPHLPLRPLHRPALLHLHCHHKSVLGADAERSLLGALALDLHEPEDGCCGMAGSFGFEAPKYDVSMRCAEHALLPAVRAWAPDGLLIADGYSCREQIAQATGRQVHHLAEVLRMAQPEQ